MVETKSRFPLNFSLFLCLLFFLSLSLIFTEVFFPLRTRFFLARLPILIMSTIHLFLFPWRRRCIPGPFLAIFLGMLPIQKVPLQSLDTFLFKFLPCPITIAGPQFLFPSSLILPPPFFLSLFRIPLLFLAPPMFLITPLLLILPSF